MMRHRRIFFWKTFGTAQAQHRHNRKQTLLRVGFRSLRVFLFLALLLTACTSPATQTAEPIPNVTVAVTPTSTPEILTTPEPDPSGPVTLRIWLPPQFDPAVGTPAADLLLARLHAFSTLYPGVRVEVRIKALDGPGGILDALSATGAVSPAALPDLVALPQHTMEAGAREGLLFAYDDLLDLSADTDWYAYAMQLGRAQGRLFGLPFAGDGLVMVYRPEVVGDPPVDWTTSLQLDEVLLFPAGSPQALFTVALYEAAGGELQDANGQFALNTATLAAVLRYYEDARDAGVMPDWITVYEDETKAWDAYQAGRVNLAVTWLSNHLRAPLPDTAATLLPTPGGVPFAPADGWMWALTTPDAERQALSAALAVYLTESDFLASWTQAAGYLPPRPSALGVWPETPQRALASRFILSAKIIPSLQILDNFGAAFQQATTDVLTGQTDPQAAAQRVEDRLMGP